MAPYHRRTALRYFGEGPRLLGRWDSIVQRALSDTARQHMGSLAYVTAAGTPVGCGIDSQRRKFQCASATW